MNITKELLKRYGMGLCTEAEKKAVEEWFDALEYPSMRVSSIRRPKANKERIWSKLTQNRPQLDKRMDLRKAKNAILLHNINRYAAAACWLSLTFIVGLLSSNYFNFSGSKSMASQREADLHGYISIFNTIGKNEKVIRNNAKVTFDGALNLYNNSSVLKTIVCNGIEYKLHPQKYYVIDYLKPGHLYNSAADLNLINNTIYGQSPSSFGVCL